VQADLSLLCPEWQGCGASSSVHRSAMTLAGSFGGLDRFTLADAPVSDHLTTREGVLGLDSIAPRFRRLIETLRHEGPERLFHIGGTCGTELAPVGYLNERLGGTLAVVWLDAHGDLNTPASSPSGHFHGMVLRTLLGHGPDRLTRVLRRPLRPAQVFLAGTRDLDPPEAQYVTGAGISITTSDELATPGVLVTRIRDAGFRQVYVHLDLDVLDPARFAHSLMQTPGGVSPDTLAAAIRALNEAFDLVGFSVVEFRQESPDGLAAVRTLLRETGVRIGALSSLNP